MTISDHRLRCGRLSVYIEPRDLWIGLFRDPPRAWYVVPFPTVVFKWTRHDAPASPGPETARADRAEETIRQHEDLLSSIVLYIKWRYVTKQITTEQKELFAAAIERDHDRVHGPGGEDPDPEAAGLPSYAPRWWRPDFAEPVELLGEGFSDDPWRLEP